MSKTYTYEQLLLSDCGEGVWGKNCGNQCNCGSYASRCDPKEGCKCQEGWTGTYCDKDVDECQSNPCSNSQICENTKGGFNCPCLTGYKREGTGCVGK